ncbi:MAG: methyltransferase [Deltaproteobacteria bacterium]|nr:methyltransferase [Deltaproteobacteria bacterium]
MPPVRFRYQTLDIGEFDIHVRTLRDKLQYSDEGGRAEALGISLANWPMFGVVWDSGEALARLMVDYDVAGRRVLEVGCGIGLASLVLNQRHADITATDHHPEAGAFLQTNVGLNGGAPIPFVRTGWTDALVRLPRFDLIIGSDLLYERGHPEALSMFIDQHSHPCCEVIIADPGRHQGGRFTRSMTGFGYDRQPCASPSMEPSTPFVGQMLRYTRTVQSSDG